MDHINYKFLCWLPRNRKLVAELRQAAAMISQTLKAIEERAAVVHDRTSYPAVNYVEFKEHKMRWNTHLTFKGQCETAFKFYEKCLGGTIVMMLSYENSPMAEQAPPDWHNKILHATFALGDQILTGGDEHPATYEKPRGFSILLNVGAADEADRVFAMLAENGEVRMPVQETFWALRFGMLVDQFGIPWMINCGNPA